MLSTLNLRALGVAGLATLALIAMVILGSRNLQNFDAALIAYLFGSIFAWFGLVYRYTVWLQRPPTKRYWNRGWRLFLSPRILVYTWEVVAHAVIDLTAFRFIKHRGTQRWFAHALFGWGCLLAFGVTFPLTFGWIHFWAEGRRYRHLRSVRVRIQGLRVPVALVHRAQPFPCAQLLLGDGDRGRRHHPAPPAH